MPKERVADLKLIKSTIEALCAEANVAVPKDRWCIQNGDHKEYDGYAGNFSIKASNNRRPALFHSDKSGVAEEDGVFYAGCYVNAIINFWVQDNNFGKRVNANLMAVQFHRDGDTFERVNFDVDEFDDVSAGHLSEIQEGDRDRIADSMDYDELS